MTKRRHSLSLREHGGPSSPRSLTSAEGLPAPINSKNIVASAAVAWAAKIKSNVRELRRNAVGPYEQEKVRGAMLAIRIMVKEARICPCGESEARRDILESALWRIRAAIADAQNCELRKPRATSYEAAMIRACADGLLMINNILTTGGVEEFSAQPPTDGKKNHPIR